MTPDWKPQLDAIVGARHGGRTDHVLPALRRLDAAHPQVAEIAAELAFSLAASGEHQAAVVAYERAFALGLPSAAEHANVLVGHAVALLRLGRAAEAVPALERARAQFPDHAEFTAFLAVAKHRAGSADDAFRLLLGLLVETSEDIGVSAHQRTLRSLLIQ